MVAGERVNGRSARHLTCCTLRCADDFETRDTSNYLWQNRCLGWKNDGVRILLLEDEISHMRNYHSVRCMAFHFSSMGQRLARDTLIEIVGVLSAGEARQDYERMVGGRCVSRGAPKLLSGV